MIFRRGEINFKRYPQANFQNSSNPAPRANVLCQLSGGWGQVSLGLLILIKFYTFSPYSRPQSLIDPVKYLGRTCILQRLLPYNQANKNSRF